MGGDAGAQIIFEGRNRPQQVIHHWKVGESNYVSLQREFIGESDSF